MVLPSIRPSLCAYHRQLWSHVFAQRYISAAMQPQLLTADHVKKTRRPTHKKPKVKKTETKNYTEAIIKTWKPCMINRLQVEYSEKEKRMKTEAKTRSLLLRISNYIRHDKLREITDFLQEELRENTLSETDAEVYSVILKFFANSLKAECETTHTEKVRDDGMKVNKKLDRSTLDKLFVCMEKMPLTGRDSRLAFILALEMLANNPLAKRSHGIITALKRRLASEMGRYDEHYSINGMLFTKEEADLIRANLPLYCNSNPVEKKASHQLYDYNEDIAPLTGDLKKPLPAKEEHSSKESVYIGSPFLLPEKDEDHYKVLFRDQLRLEEDYFLTVKNTVRESKEPKSMEDLINEWNWKGNIKEELTKQLEKLESEDLKCFLDGVDLEECAQQLLLCAYAVSCKSRTFNDVAEIERAAFRIITRHLKTEFLHKIGCSGKEFLQFYRDDDIPRTHSIRAWWNKCAADCGVEPNFYAPFAKIFDRSSSKISNMLVNILINACQFKAFDSNRREVFVKAFRYDRVLTHRTGYENNLITEACEMLGLHADFLMLINKHEFRNWCFPSESLPMRIPPRPWVDYGECGPFYSHSYAPFREAKDYPEGQVNDSFRERIRRVVETKKRHKGKAREEAQVRPVFDALNDLGSTAWIINEPVLKILMQAVENSDLRNGLLKEEELKSLSIPQHPKSINPPDPDVLFGSNWKRHQHELEQTTAWNRYHKELKLAKKRRNEAAGLRAWLVYRLFVANQYIGSHIYLPHSMDFRGRVYPVMHHLSHMGDDISRGILKFARGRPLGPNGLEWLKLHCVNLTGKLKREPLYIRRKYAHEILEDKIIDSAINPYNGKRWWMESEDPWQTLATCMEIRDALDSNNPANFISHLPVHQDGSCNGLQHYAALGRDARGGNEINLVPCDVPNDVYSSVTERVEKKRLELEKLTGEDAELAKKLRVAMPGEVPRKVLKQSVMTTVYGVTAYGARLQILRQLKDRGIIEDANLFAGLLQRLTFQSLDESFSNAIAIMGWLKECAKAGVRLLKPIEWITPLGLPVAQPYVRTKTDGKSYLIPDIVKQTNAFPPNFIHALDSTHMMLTTLYCRHRGITYAAIHDCYWTHACDVDQMNVILRDRFVALNKQEIIKELSESLLRSHVTPIENDIDRFGCPNLSNDRERIEEGFEELKKPFVIDQKYLSGDLVIENVRDSEYFFS